ncbi:alpha-L-iduronidase isoform X2 [Ochlerotatus camptorhynchus]|uniref:alpha-L-iduronidase isoform X2 n=1 Tax=Ochlerotatus camptorhynchus TaxID=644619 RepID=UPI0031E2377A
MFVLLVLVVVVVNIVDPSMVVHEIDVDFELVLQKGKPLPRFWTSTGLCPPAPREKSAEFLLSDDSLLNLEIIGSLPNEGLKYVRIHWLLEMMSFSHYDERKTLFYEFSRLDALLDKLQEFGLHPGFEFMGIPAGIYEKERRHRFVYFWTDLAMQVASHYLRRYGIKYVSNWRFETWNEPDLRGYNVLNFTVNEYINYVQSIRFGLDAAGRLLNNIHLPLHGNIHLPLHGPAGLFKSTEHHPFCWSALKLCNDSPKKCPFEVITFHRKGSGLRADEIVQGGVRLVEQLQETFPNISEFRFSNNEADPIAGWSTPREFQSNLKYGSMLVSTVLQHWSVLFTGRLRNLESISHDNGFLSYYPFEFDQRTLLARFQMNLTQPRHVQFVVKPVFSALGMLANLGPMATDRLHATGNISYIVSYQQNPFYLCILLVSSNDTFEPVEKRQKLSVNIVTTKEFVGQPVAYIVEGLQSGLNDPNSVWQYYGKPPYPTGAQFEEMRSVQFPSVLEGPTVLPIGRKRLKLNFNLRAPWLATVRMCSLQSSKPSVVQNVRVRRIHANEVLIFWHENSAGVRYDAPSAMRYGLTALIGRSIGRKLIPNGIHRLCSINLRLTFTLLVV